MQFTFYHQLNAMDCGPTALRMVAMYYGKHYNADTLRNIAGFNKEGVSLLGISETAEKIGFRSRGVQLTFGQLKEAPLPCILHWQQNHFVVLISISKNKSDSYRIKVADPVKQLLIIQEMSFLLIGFLRKQTIMNKQVSHYS